MTIELFGPRSEEEMRLDMARLQPAIEHAINRMGDPRRFDFLMVVYDRDDPDRHYYLSGPRPKLSKNLLLHLLEEIERRENSPKNSPEIRGE